MMAADFVIGFLLIISSSVNILALGAFWSTPSLRTTANRFVINLLLVNFVSCIILAPSLLLNAITGQNNHKTIDYHNDNLVNTGINQLPMFQNSNIINFKNCTEILIENISNDNTQISLFAEINQIEDIVITLTTTLETPDQLAIDNQTKLIDRKLLKNNNLDENNDDENEYFGFTIKTRCWGLDLAASLGALSVLLVVSDTWCAVTDPLRYHTRISGLKAYCYISATWLLSIIFAIASAFRSKYRKIPSDVNIFIYTDDDLYSTIYSCAYFMVIILLPFILVCCMYWRIISEARENGIRMRQNGSSPLLQSALNLAAPSSTQQYPTSPVVALQQLQSPPLSTTIVNVNNNYSPNSNANVVVNQMGGGLTMKIDKQPFGVQQDGSHKPLLSATPVHQTHLTVPKDNEHYHYPQPKCNGMESDSNQNNIILESPMEPPTAESIRRNHSARHLFLFDAIDDSKSEMRHVHSTPNLLKAGQLLPGQRQLTATTAMPSVQVPPKALSYMTSIRHRLSNASSLFKYREESRAARISILVVIMFLVSYVPFGILVLMQGHIALMSANNQVLLAISTVVMANLSSPFIFAYRNKRVRRGVRRLLGIDAKTNERLHRRTIHSSRLSRIRRSVSKTSTYSVNSCKYLTPSMAAAKTTYVLEIEKCSPSPEHEKCKSKFIGDIELFKGKKSILKRVCDSSRKWGCATTSCANGNNTEQTDV